MFLYCIFCIVYQPGVVLCVCVCASSDNGTACPHSGLRGWQSGAGSVARQPHSAIHSQVVSITSILPRHMRKIIVFKIYCCIEKTS